MGRSGCKVGGVVDTLGTVPPRWGTGNPGVGEPREFSPLTPFVAEPATGTMPGPGILCGWVVNGYSKECARQSYRGDGDGETP